MNPIQKLIEDDRIEEAIEKLLNSTKNDRHLHTSIQQLKSRFSRLNKENWGGVLSTEDAGLERNKITRSLLEISEQVDFGVREGKKSSFYRFIGVGVLILVIGVGLTYQEAIWKHFIPVCETCKVPADCKLEECEACSFCIDIKNKKDSLEKIRIADSLYCQSVYDNLYKIAIATEIKNPCSSPKYELTIDGINLTALFNGYLQECLKERFSCGVVLRYKVVNYDDIDDDNGNYFFKGGDLKLQLKNSGKAPFTITGVYLEAIEGDLTKNQVKDGVPGELWSIGMKGDIANKLKKVENIKLICKKIKI